MSPVVSTCTAPLSARSGPSSRVMSRRSRSTIDASTSLDLAADLAHPALGPLPRRRGDEQLQRRVREHDGADVAALDHAAATLARPAALAAAQLLAHRRVGGDRLTASVTARPRMSAVASTPSTTTDALVHRQRHRLGQFGDRRLVAHRHPTRQGEERHRPVHRPGVEVLEAEAVGQRPADRALAGAGRAVDGDDAHGTPSPTRAAGEAPRRTRRCSARRPRPDRRTRPGRTPRRTCTPSARRRRSGRGCPRHPVAPGRGTSATC